MNITELAKECGARVNWKHVDKHGRRLVTAGISSVTLSESQLTAFSNAIVEEVEKDLRSKFVGIADIVDAIRALKVEV